MISVGLEGNSIALPWHSVHCDLPLAPWVMKGLINESIRVSVCCSQAQTCPVSGHTEERDAIAGRPDEWVAHSSVTKTNVTAPVSQKGGGAQLPRGEHVVLTTSPL